LIESSDSDEDGNTTVKTLIYERKIEKNEKTIIIEEEEVFESEESIQSKKEIFVFT
jgi:hypothetical protein